MPPPAWPVPWETWRASSSTSVAVGETSLEGNQHVGISVTSESGELEREVRELLDTLARDHKLPLEGYRTLVAAYSPVVAEYAASLAVQQRQETYGNAVFVRGLIELSSYCKNDCLYCGIRHSNASAERYRLSREQIMDCCEQGYELGFRTFVLQGGEDPTLTDEVVCGLVRAIKERYPDCAITLSLGERSRASYQALFDAGADRYLLRHETADAEHYAHLHPKSMSFERRMQCLRDLKEIGYQVGCGFMVGSPWQTPDTLAKDLKFIEGLRPAMCGIGPFVPHHATPFADREQGTVALTCYLLSLLRLIDPTLNIPATTALGTIDPRGRERGIKSGANVVMPNLSPRDVRKKYELYDNKICTGEEAAECRSCLARRMGSIGYEVVVDRGDARQAAFASQGAATGPALLAADPSAASCSATHAAASAVEEAFRHHRPARR